MKAPNFLEPKPFRAFRDKYLAAALMVAALFISIASSAQTTDSTKYSQINGYGFKYKRHVQDSVSIIPLSTSPHTPYRAGGIRYRASDSTIQIWTGYQWNSIITGVGNGVDTAYRYDDSTLAIETPDQDFFITLPGRHWDLQGILNNGSTLAENENIVLPDSLELTSGLVVIDSLRLRTLTTTIDTTTYKPLGVGSDGRPVKFPGWPGGGGSRTGDTVVYLSRSSGIVSDADISPGATTFGTDNTTAAQAVLDIASHTQGLHLVWDVRISTTGLRIGPNTFIHALPSYGAILRNNSDKPLFRNRDTAFGREPVDSNITVQGGIWNGNSFNSVLNPAQAVGTPANGTTAVFSFYGVRNLIVRDFIIYRQRTYAIAGNNLKNALYENGVIDAGDGGIFSDGVHFDGNSEHCTARNLKIKAIDDAVGLNADDAYDNPSSPVYGYFPASAAGPISDVQIENIFLDNGQFGVRILSGSSRVDNIRIKNLTGSTIGYAVVIDNFYQDTSVIINSGVGNVGRVQIENVDVDITNVPGFAINQAMINLRTTAESIILKDLKRYRYTYPSISTVRVTGSYTNIKSLVIDGYDAIDTTIAGIEHILIEDATINSLSLQRVNLKRNTQGSGLMGSNNAIINKIQVNNVVLDSINYVYFNSSSTVNSMTVDNVNHISRMWGTYNTVNNSGGTISSIAVSNYLGSAPTMGAFGSKIGDAFPATTTQPGYVTTGAQDIGGNKDMYGRTLFVGSIRIPMPVENSFIDAYSTVSGNDAMLFRNNSLGATVGIKNLNASGFSGIEYLSEAGVSKVFSGLNNANGQEFRFNNFTSGGYINFLTGGNIKMVVNNTGGITLNQLSVPVSTYNVLVHGLTDSIVYQVPASAFGGNGIYGGSGSLPGNVTVTGGNNSITWSDIFAFNILSDYNTIQKANGTGIYTESIVGAGNIYELGFTPTAGTFSKGAGLFIDTNNNVGLGTNPPTTIPLYATGASTFVQGFQSNQGNFYRVDNFTDNFTAALTYYFIKIDATSQNITMTLPAASTAFGNSMGITYVIQRIDNSVNTVTIQRAGSDTINGATSFTLGTQWETKNLTCTSTSTWAQH